MRRGAAGHESPVDGARARGLGAAGGDDDEPARRVARRALPRHVEQPRAGRQLLWQHGGHERARERRRRRHAQVAAKGGRGNVRRVGAERGGVRACRRARLRA